MQPQKITDEIVNAAIQGFEAQKQHIDSQIAELRSLLRGGVVVSATESGGVKLKRKFSAAALQRMRDAQRLRWARARGESTPRTAHAAPASKGKRRLSAAGRRAISEAAKKRWAALRAENQKAQLAGSRKTATKKATGRRVMAKKSAKKHSPAAGSSSMEHAA